LVAESTGGVSPVGWISAPEFTPFDEASNDNDVGWAAVGHPHAVFPTTFKALDSMTNVEPMIVGD